jgi:hypothetical protein
MSVMLAILLIKLLYLIIIDIPKVGMTDDEAKEKSKELATIRESKKQTQAQTGLENFEFASSSKPIGQYVQMNANGLQTAFGLFLFLFDHTSSILLILKFSNHT